MAGGSLGGSCSTSSSRDDVNSKLRRHCSNPGKRCQTEYRPHESDSSSGRRGRRQLHRQEDLAPISPLASESSPSVSLLQSNNFGTELRHSPPVTFLGATPGPDPVNTVGLDDIEGSQSGLEQITGVVEMFSDATAILYDTSRVSEEHDITRLIQPYFAVKTPWNLSIFSRSFQMTVKSPARANRPPAILGQETELVTTPKAIIMTLIKTMKRAVIRKDRNQTSDRAI
ncbi:hypothetical protein VTN96DRAFT_10270 [Rasamsonia emersonii]